MPPEMPDLLNSAAAAVCHALEALLPSIHSEWWPRCVAGKLTFQQRQQLERRGINRLDQLDLAALLRIVDQNWFELADFKQWPYEGRNFIKEMQTVRNRWAHVQVSALPLDDVYRDLDTLQRFLALICPQDALAEEVAAAKKGLLVAQADPQATAGASAPVMPPPAATRFALGDVVRFKADPSKSGAVTVVLNGDKETRYQVFHDGKIASYYESQLLPQEASASEEAIISLTQFHARLTALQLLHPSISNLYSLHAARIEVIPYQFRPVLKFIRADRPRLLIADSVGVGKTIEAGLILRELQARRDIRKVLIVCPRPLVTEQKWRREMKRFDENFQHLDGDTLRYCLSEYDLDGEWPQQYEKVIMPFSLLTDEILHGKGYNKGLLDIDPPLQFDLVIVDEAHHIRNSSTQRSQAIQYICENADAVVFLTATPIQLGNHDLFVLLNTLRPDLIIDEETYAAITEPNADINLAAISARKGEPGWTQVACEALQRATQTAWGQAVLQSDPRFQEIYDSLDGAEHDRSARVQAIRDIEQLHTLSGLMNRTLRRDIGHFTQRKPETVAVDFTPEQKAIHDAVLAAQAAVFAALHGDHSVNFLLSTIRRQASSCIYGLAPLLKDILSRRLDDLDLDETDDSEERPDTVRAAVRIMSLIQNALELAEKLPTDPGTDPKYLALQKIIREKQALPNNKIILFATFRHTLTYLYSALQRDGFRVGLIHGGVDDATRVSLRSRFEMARDESEALDAMLFSEVGCEGLDYQFCDCMVNYDIPWNPMRIDQRIGRIDRWGQASEAVAIYNFITPGTVDADIYERCLMRIGVFECALGANEAILGEITREITSVAENLSLSAVERQRKLDQLADNSIRLVREQQDLEKQQTELFGLHVPTDQYKKDVEDASSFWLSAMSLERLVTEYLCMHTGKEESPVVGVGAKKVLRLSRITRDVLLKDYDGLPNRTSALAREWQTWLKGNNPHQAITFDSEYATEDRTASLITPVHPLAIQSARAIGLTAQAVPVVGIKVKSSVISPGDYPFAIYQWQYHGIRASVEFKPVAADPLIARNFFDFMPESTGFDIGGNAVTDDMRRTLERQHYESWSDARAQHIDQTLRVVEFRRGSLQTSHKARIAMIDSQIAQAQNNNIRVMKTAQKANAVADYQRRLKDIEEASAKVDITTQSAGWGIIRIVSV